LIEYMSRREKATTQSPLRTCEYDPNALVWGTSGDRRSYCLTWFQVPKEWVKENALLYLHLQHCSTKQSNSLYSCRCIIHKGSGFEIMTTSLFRCSLKKKKIH
jgi:hypothetical protein